MSIAKVEILYVSAPIRLRWVTACLLMMAVGVPTSFGEDDVKRGEIAPDPLIVRLLDRALEAMTEPDPARARASYREALFDLYELADRDGVQMVQQLVLYASQAKSLREGMLPYVVLEMSQISKGQIVQAIAPMFGMKNAKLRAQIEELAAVAATADALDVSHYRSYIRSYIVDRRRKGKSVEPGLLAFLFHRIPGTVFADCVMMEYVDPEQRKPLLWAEHVVSDTLWKQKYGFLDREKVEPESLEQLEMLSRRREWWARLYVAEICRQHPAFRREEIVQRLRKDEHPLVRKAIEARTR